MRNALQISALTRGGSKVVWRLGSDLECGGRVLVVVVSWKEEVAAMARPVWSSCTVYFSTLLSSLSVDRQLQRVLDSHEFFNNLQHSKIFIILYILRPVFQQPGFGSRAVRDFSILLSIFYKFYSTICLILCLDLLLSQSLELPSLVLRTLSKRYTKLEQLDNYIPEVVEESVVILGVLIDKSLELLVLDESHVCGQHHDRFVFIDVLLGTVPLLPVPLPVHKELVVIVGQDSWREGPGTIKARSVGVASAQSVGAGKGNNLLVVEAHAVENVPQVVLSLGGVRKAAIRCTGSYISVRATWSVWDLGSQHLLNGANATKNPKVRVADPGEFFCLSC